MSGEHNAVSSMRTNGLDTVHCACGWASSAQPERYLATMEWIEHVEAARA